MKGDYVWMNGSSSLMFTIGEAVDSLWADKDWRFTAGDALSNLARHAVCVLTLSDGTSFIGSATGDDPEKARDEAFEAARNKARASRAAQPSGQITTVTGGDGRAYTFQDGTPVL